MHIFGGIMTDPDLEPEDEPRGERDEINYDEYKPLDATYLSPDDEDDRPVIPHFTTGSVALCVVYAGVALLIGRWVHQNDLPTPITWVVASIMAALIALRLVRGSLEDAEELFRWEMEQRPHVPLRVRQFLSPDGERVYILTREHPISLTPWTVAMLLATWGGGYFGGKLYAAHAMPALRALGAMWAVVAAIAGYKWLRWSRKFFVVTNLYVNVFDDTFSDEHPSMPVTAVTGAKRITPFFFNLLAWLRVTRLKIGTFVLETASQEEAINKVGWLAGANIYEQIVKSLAQGKSPFAEPDGTMG